MAAEVDEDELNGLFEDEEDANHGDSDSQGEEWKAKCVCDCCGSAGAGFLLVFCKNAGETHLIGRHQFCMPKPYSQWPTPGDKKWNGVDYTCEVCKKTEALLERFNNLMAPRRNAVHPSILVREDAGRVASTRTSEPQSRPGRPPREPRPPAGVFSAAGLNRHRHQQQEQQQQGTQVGPSSRHQQEQQQGGQVGKLSRQQQQQQHGMQPRRYGGIGLPRAQQGPRTKQSKRMGLLGRFARPGAAGGRGNVVKVGPKNWERKGGVALESPKGDAAAGVPEPGLGDELNAAVTLHILNKQRVIKCRIKRSAEVPLKASQAATGFPALLQLLGRVQRFNVVVLPKMQLPGLVADWLADPDKVSAVAIFDAANDSGAQELSWLVPKDRGAIAVATPRVTAGTESDLPAPLRGQPLVLMPISAGKGANGSSLALRWPKSSSDLLMLKEQLQDAKALAEEAAAAGWEVQPPPPSPVAQLRAAAIPAAVLAAAGAGAAGGAGGSGGGGGKGADGKAVEDQQKQQKTPTKDGGKQQQEPEPQRQSPQKQQQQEPERQKHTPQKQQQQEPQHQKHTPQKQQEEEEEEDIGNIESHMGEFQQLAEQFTASDDEDALLAALASEGPHLQESAFLLPDERHKHPLRRDQQQQLQQPLVQMKIPGQKVGPRVPEHTSSDGLGSRPPSITHHHHHQQQQALIPPPLRPAGQLQIAPQPVAWVQHLPLGMQHPYRTANPYAPSAFVGGFAPAAAPGAAAGGAAGYMPAYGSGAAAVRAAGFAALGGGGGYMPGGGLQTQLSGPERQRRAVEKQREQERLRQERQKEKVQQQQQQQEEEEDDDEEGGEGKEQQEEQEQLELGAEGMEVDEGVEDGEVSAPRRVTPPAGGSDDGTVGESHYHDCLSAEDMLTAAAVADSGATAEKRAGAGVAEEGQEPPAKRRKADAVDNKVPVAVPAAAAATTPAVDGGSRGEAQQQQHHRQPQLPHPPSSESFSRDPPPAAAAPGSTSGAGALVLPPAAPTASAGPGMSGQTASLRTPTTAGGGAAAAGAGLPAVVQMLEQSPVGQLLQRLRGTAGDGRQGVMSYWDCCVPGGTILTRGNLRVVCLGFSEAHWVQLQPIVQALRAQQHLTILRDELHPLQEALTAPDLREDIRGSAEQRPVRRQVPTILVLPERVRPGGLGHILRRLQQQRQHQQQQEVLQRVPAPAAAPGGDSSVVDCACSSGSIQQRKGGGSTEQQQRQQVGVEMTPWSLLAAPVGVFYEGYGEGVLTAVHVQQKVDSFIVDCQLHRRGLVVVVGACTLINLRDRVKTLTALLDQLASAQSVRGCVPADWQLAVRQSELPPAEAEQLEELKGARHGARLLFLDDVLPLDSPDGAPSPHGELNQRASASQPAAAAGGLQEGAAAVGGTPVGLPAAAPLAGAHVPGDEEFDVDELRQLDLRDAVRLARHRQRLMRLVVAVLPDLEVPRPPCSQRASADQGGCGTQQQPPQKACPGWVREYMRDMLVGAQQVGEVMVGSMSQVRELLDLIVQRGRQR